MTTAPASPTARDVLTQLEAEARAISACGGEPDALEGVAAFVGRRAPVFDRD